VLRGRGQRTTRQRVLDEQCHVAAPAITLRHAAPDHARLLQYVEVVGEEVGPQAEQLAELAG
jgi:hypothetical protein